MGKRAQVEEPAASRSVHRDAVLPQAFGPVLRAAEDHDAALELLPRQGLHQFDKLSGVSPVLEAGDNEKNSLHDVPRKPTRSASEGWRRPLLALRAKGCL